MIPRAANIYAFGWKAQDFALRGVDGKTYSLLTCAGRRVRSSSHLQSLPLVKAYIERIVAEAKALTRLASA